MPPLISIITPVYNVAPFLEQSLESILTQSFPDFELICIDDGSTDASPGILAGYAKKDSRVRVFTQAHGGLARARNRALAEATGEYIVFADGDDYWSPEILTRVLPHLTDDVDYVCFGTQVFGQAPADLQKQTDRYCNPVYSGLLDVDELVIKKTNVQVWNKVFRRSLISRHGLSFPDGLFYEDIFFTLAYFFLSRRAYYLRERLYYYRLRSDSIMGLTRDGDFDRAADHLAVVLELFKFMRARSLLPGREAFLAKRVMQCFRLSLKYASPASDSRINAMLDQFFKEAPADAAPRDKAAIAVFQALLRDAQKARRPLKRLIAAPWRWMKGKLGMGYGLEL